MPKSPIETDPLGFRSGTGISFRPKVDFSQIPEEVRAFVAGQLGLLWDSSEAYSWHGSTLDFRLAQIRQHSGWRFPTAQDKEELENWLRNQGAKEADTLFDSACERLRSLRVEDPFHVRLSWGAGIIRYP